MVGWSQSGMLNLDRPRLRAIASEGFHRLPDGRVHFDCVRATIQPDGAIRIEKSGEQKSHVLRTLADANALAILPDGPGVRSGEDVEILLLDVDRLETMPNDAPLSPRPASHGQKPINRM